MQNRLMRIFHYALRASSYLFLGLSEGVSRHGELFAVFDKKHRLFQRRDDVVASLPTGALRPAPAPAASAQPARMIGDGIEERVRHALENYSPAYVVINRQHEVVHFSRGTGQYIEHSPGAASLDLFGILRKDLLPTVRTAVQKAFATREPVVHDDLVLALNGNSKIVNLVVVPITEEADTELYVVAFQDRGVAARRSAAAATGASAGSRVQALEKELHAARTQLQHTIDDLETANEELKSSNEEYQSVNEEFQSTNEELESSKEELQSINEELNTINNELTAKNDALAEANSDIKNLLDSTLIATLFLDMDLRIRNFTPAMTELFHMRAGDRGRPITDIVTRLSYPDLIRDVKKVLDSLSRIEHEVTVAHDGSTFLMRILPYRTVDNVIAGVVITFTDITERKRQEEERGTLAAIVDSSQDAIIGHSLEGMITSWNAGAEQIFGYTAKEVVGKPLSVLIPEHQFDGVPHILGKLAQGERVEDFEIRRVTKSGKSIDISMTISPVRNATGIMIGAATVGRDISERKRADDLRGLMINELNHRVKNTLATVQSIAAHSLEGGLDVESRKNFDARLVALSRTHDLLALESWESASLRDMLLQEVEPYGSGDRTRFVIEGPDVELGPKAALALGMTFHELATNAAKYGALSNPTGEVRVTWDFLRSSEPPALQLRWAETGGPRVEKTGRKGFGSTVIERGVSLELDGEVRLDFEPGGVVCTIDIPLGSANITERGSR
jgi:two-component system, chemotaxis family, CheB/CheR fusion protein